MPLHETIEVLKRDEQGDDLKWRMGFVEKCKLVDLEMREMLIEKRINIKYSELVMIEVATHKVMLEKRKQVNKEIEEFITKID